MPFKSLRSVSSQKIQGDINLAPQSYPFSEVKLTADEVKALPLDEQVWDIGYVLDPALHGKGVMSEMVGCILEGWVKPWMRIGIVAAVRLSCISLRTGKVCEREREADEGLDFA